MRRLLLALISLALFACNAAVAAKLNIVESFCGLKDCRYAGTPSGLARDSAGNLYGVTGGSRGNLGKVIYELANGKDYKLLYVLCPRRECPSGDDPSGPLVVDVAGNLYGTMSSGGSQNLGTVFELSPDAERKHWSAQVLYNFCSQNNCADGSFPSGGLTYVGAQSGALYDGVSPLYGVAEVGGADGGGVVFQLTPGEQGWTETVIHDFCAGGGKCTDGAMPNALLFDSAGNLFGTAGAGGASGAGVVYRLDAGNWTESVLYNFCSQKKCADGENPFGLVQDSSGTLFGTTGRGGRTCRIANLQNITCGLAYQLSSNGDAWQETVLHTFCSLKDCKDGALPQAPLLLDSAGNLFGSTVAGGGNDVDPNGNGGGVLFELSGTMLNVLHHFCAEGGSACTDGYWPTGNLVMDGSGHVFGTTQRGGPDGGGEVFRLTP